MDTDKRQSLRKTLRTKAILSIEGSNSLAVDTMDIGKYGMCLVNIPRVIATGQQVRVAFELFLNSQLVNVTTHARIAYCLPNDGGFKAGLQFLHLDSPEAGMIAQYTTN